MIKQYKCPKCDSKDVIVERTSGLTLNRSNNDFEDVVLVCNDCFCYYMDQVPTSKKIIELTK